MLNNAQHARSAASRLDDVIDRSALEQAREGLGGRDMEEASDWALGAQFSFESLSIGERERTTETHGRGKHGIEKRALCAKGGSRSRREQRRAAQAKTSCGEPAPSQRPGDPRTAVTNLPRQPSQQPSDPSTSAHHQHGNHVKSSLCRGKDESMKEKEDERNRKKGSEEEGERSLLRGAPAATTPTPTANPTMPPADATTSSRSPAHQHDLVYPLARTRA